MHMSAKVAEMKILFINNFFAAYGGAEKLMLNQACLLSEKGHQVVFFATDKQPFAREDYEYAEFFPKFTDYKALTGVEAIKNLPGSFYNSESEAKLLRLLNLVEPDIVHCHNICYHLTPSVLSACRKFNVPVVMTLHDPRLVCPGGTMMYKSRSYCSKEHCVRGNPFYGLICKCRNSSLKQSLVSTFEYLFSRANGFYDYVSLFICPSRAVYNLAEKSGINPGRLVVLNNFIDEGLFEVPPVFSNSGYFLYIGRLAREKGVHYLIEAAKFLPKNIEFHIAGDGPEKQNLERQTESLALPNIKFRGYLEGDRLKKEFSGCIATILPCNWFETFGLTIAESFAYGKPVIASRIGAIPELVSENTDGLLFEPGNEEQLSQAVYRLYRERELVAEMGKNARHKAKKLFNRELHYKNLIKVYNFAKSGLN